MNSMFVNPKFTTYQKLEKYSLFKKSSQDNKRIRSDSSVNSKTNKGKITMNLQSIIKEEDRENVKTILLYLIEKGFTVSLEGSVKEGKADYRDIDLKAIGTQEQIEEIIEELKGTEFRVSDIPITLDSWYKNMDYVGASIEHRLVLNVPRINIGSTKIDLSFKLAESIKTTASIREGFEESASPRYPVREVIKEEFNPRNVVDPKTKD